MILATFSSFPVDVRHCGTLRTRVSPNPTALAHQNPLNQYRPLIGGISIGHPSVTAGTFNPCCHWI